MERRIVVTTREPYKEDGLTIELLARSTIILKINDGEPLYLKKGVGQWKGHEVCATLVTGGVQVVITPIQKKAPPKPKNENEGSLSQGQVMKQFASLPRRYSYV